MRYFLRPFSFADAEQLQQTLAAIKASIERLGREDRAVLRRWILAGYDVRGYPAPGFAGSACACEGPARSRTRKARAARLVRSVVRLRRPP